MKVVAFPPWLREGMDAYLSWRWPAPPHSIKIFLARASAEWGVRLAPGFFGESPEDRNIIEACPLPKPGAALGFVSAGFMD